MSLQNVFKALRIQAKVNIKEYAKQLDYPSGIEPGLKNVESGATLLCRDDGVVEAMSGAGAVVLVDGPAQTVGIRGGAVTLKGNTVQIQTPAGGLWFGYQRFNPAWFSPAIDPLATWAWQKAPLVQNSPTSLSLQVLTGVPAPGQVPVPLATVLQPLPLFGPNEQLRVLASHLGELLRSVSDT